MSARLRAAASLLLVCVAGATPARAQTQTQARADWVVSRVHVRVAFEPDGRLVAAESLDLEVPGAPLQSFIRRIPTLMPYNRGFRREYPFELVGVTDSDGNRQQVRLTDEPESRALEIGSPDTPITSARSLRLVYRVWNAVTPGTGGEALRWPAVGPWTVPVNAATVVLRPPAGSLFGGECRLVQPGGDSEPCVARFGLDEVTFLSGRVMAPGEILMLSASLRPGSVPSGPPRLVPRIRGFREYFDPAPAAVAVLLGGLALVTGLAGVAVARWRRASVPAVGRALPAEPLRPAVWQLLLDPRSRLFDPVPTIVDLAIRGYISLADIPGAARDWRMERHRESDASLAPHERVVLDGLFGARTTVKVSDLGGQFAATCREAARRVRHEAVDAGWISGHEAGIRTSVRLVAFGLAAAGVVGVVVLGRRLGLGLAAAPLLFAAVALWWAERHWPALTREGQRQRRDAITLAARLRDPRPPIEADLATFLPHAVAAEATRPWLEAFPGVDCRHAMPWFAGRTSSDVASFGLGLGAFGEALTRGLGSDSRS